MNDILTDEQVEIIKGEGVYHLADGYSRTLPSGLKTPGVVASETEMRDAFRADGTPSLDRDGNQYRNEEADIVIEIRPNVWESALAEFHKAFLAASDKKTFLANYHFEFEPAQMQTRENQALQQALRVTPRPSRLPQFRNPIIGLDVTADGEPVDVETLVIEVEMASNAESNAEYVSGSAYFGPASA